MACCKFDMLKKCLFISLILLHLCQCISIPNKNKDCINCIHDVRIFQTLSRDRGLAVYSQDEDRGLLDFLTKKKTTETTENIALFQVPPHLYGKIMIYDGLKIKLPEDQCFVIRDTFTYEARMDKNIKVVPIITAKDKNIEENIEVDGKVNMEVQDNLYPQKNKDCIDDIKDVKIFQTLGEDKGLSFYNGYEVALFKFPSYFKDKTIVYDGLKIKLPEDQCFVIRDTYTYETRGKNENVSPATVVVVQSKNVKTYEDKKETDIKTVPVITFDYKYEKTKLFLEEMTAEYCNKNNAELHKNGFKNKEQCNCYIDITSSRTYECLQRADKSNNNEKYEDNICIETFNKAEKEAEQKCGKLLDTKENTTNKTAKKKNVVKKK